MFHWLGLSFHSFQQGQITGAAEGWVTRAFALTVLIDQRVINEMKTVFRLRGIGKFEILPQAQEPTVLVLNGIAFENAKKTSTRSYQPVTPVTRSINFVDEAIQ